MAGAVLLSLVGSASLIAGWNRAAVRVATAADFLTAQAADADVVMFVNPPAMTLATGHPSVPPPFDPYPVVEGVVRHTTCGGSWWNASRKVELDPLGLWDAASAIDSEGNRAEFLPDQPAFESGDIRIYEITDEGG